MIKKATQWPALLILEILFNAINFDIAKVKDNISSSLNFMFNLAKKFMIFIKNLKKLIKSMTYTF